MSEESKKNHPQEVPQELPTSTLPSAKTEEKSTWPEVVGLTGEEARMKIKEEAPYVTQIHIIPPGSGWTCDYRTDRVRIHTDESGKVRSPPRVG